MQLFDTHMKRLRAFLIFFACSLTIGAQSDTALIHIKLINGTTGLPMQNQMVGLEEERGYPRVYREISSTTDATGVATILIHRDSILLTHNTHGYVDCGDEHGGLIHNDYKVSEILVKGIVEPIPPPNHYIKISASAQPGELILFVRPWMPGEDI